MICDPFSAELGFTRNHDSSLSLDLVRIESVGTNMDDQEFGCLVDFTAVIGN